MFRLTFHARQVCNRVEDQTKPPTFFYEYARGIDTNGNPLSRSSPHRKTVEIGCDELLALYNNTWREIYTECKKNWVYLHLGVFKLKHWCANLCCRSGAYKINPPVTYLNSIIDD
uniref:Uncharacterized protein n=1 Tax=Corethron hystrix TaxID=216773 RepID=A0A7S1BK20_9STRA|mmetsp:Transcript_2947/g.5529  ORF Transcript_2947/g.5529 Transcript_2947/m.5529 type:complete len:115 (+) Transcript_2947:367-711(+)